MIDKTASLTPELLSILEHKATERPFTGSYDQCDLPGTYLCRRCGLALFYSESKFHSGCGWPSFDQSLPGAVSEQMDQDQHRIEIVCSRCCAHLGHVFKGEHFTPLNTRHCVNSLSLDHTSYRTQDSEEALFAAGCFWGVEALFKKLNGVLKTEVGYSGGTVNNPSYHALCTQPTGHYEVTRVVYDPSIIPYLKIAQYFFEIHDFTQKDGQGPDRGQQYLSVGFYYNENQKKILEALVQQLGSLGYRVATQLLPVKTFWPAESDHQNYYAKQKSLPYCHAYQAIFPTE